MENYINKLNIENLDELERLETYYNFINDLKEKYNDYWIYHLDEKYFSVDEQNKFRTILGLWNNI